MQAPPIARRADDDARRALRATFSRATDVDASATPGATARPSHGAAVRVLAEEPATGMSPVRPAFRWHRKRKRPPEGGRSGSNAARDYCCAAAAAAFAFA